MINRTDHVAATLMGFMSNTVCVCVCVMEGYRNEQLNKQTKQCLIVISVRKEINKLVTYSRAQ